MNVSSTMDMPRETRSSIMALPWLVKDITISCTRLAVLKMTWLGIVWLVSIFKLHKAWSIANLRAKVAKMPAMSQVRVIWLPVVIMSVREVWAIKIIISKESFKVGYRCRAETLIQRTQARRGKKCSRRAIMQVQVAVDTNNKSKLSVVISI
jgi:hypothetical protein